MIQLTNISLSFGGHRLFDGLSWSIPPGERIGLIGKNGAGKSTLLRLIDGAERPNEGRVSVGARTSVGYLKQDVQALNSESSVLDETLTAFEDLRALEEEEERLTSELGAYEDHTDPAYEKLLHALDRVHTAMASEEAHLTRPRAEAVLTGLGFDPDEFDRAISTFSGGWRMRVMLAKLLLQHPDYLLLDEPTNHLDIESIDWLEGYLKNYDGTVVIVSHDRYFLDRMITSIAELSHGRIEEYAGNYSFYLEEREKRRELQQSAYENQQREIEQIERFIERFRYKASKAKQVQSRIKMLEKMDRVPPPESDDAAVKIRFPEPRRSGRVVLELTAFSKTYVTKEGTVEVFDEAGPLTVERGDKIALIGKNGAGKSTLARILNGSEPFDGERTLGHNVEYAFFAQHQADVLKPGDTILESLRRAAPGKSDGEIRSILGAFLFTGDDVFKPISVLSGGEKSRVALARTLLHPANFLILDEPTNHLDAQSITVLVEALRQYAGTFVVVSHDRHFLDQVANRVWYVGSQGVRTFMGNYSEFRWHAEHGTTVTVEENPSDESEDRSRRTSSRAGSSGGPKSKDQKRREAEERNRLHRALKKGGDVDPSEMTPHQLQTYYEQVEEDVVTAEKNVDRIQKQMADPEVYWDSGRVQKLNAEFESTKNRLRDLYEKWEELAERVAEGAEK
ncbi:MAG: ABC-F family ATP-binding cassette domain-containing protein [Rhodothermales bacterium]